MRLRDASKAFTSKLGAEREDSDDHIYFYLNYQGSEYTVGKLSHSWRGTLNDTQISMLARKLSLLKREFEQFVSCELSASETINLWQQQRHRRS